MGQTVLCVVDQALLPLLEDFEPVIVHLPLQSRSSDAEWDCALKREPAVGCVTTAEAVARCASAWILSLSVIMDRVDVQSV